MSAAPTCRCEPKALPDGTGDCSKCGKPLRPPDVKPKPPPTAAERARRRKIAKFWRERRESGERPPAA